jgi:hypothetical protein
MDESIRLLKQREVVLNLLGRDDERAVIDVGHKVDPSANDGSIEKFEHWCQAQRR